VNLCIAEIINNSKSQFTVLPTLCSPERKPATNFQKLMVLTLLCVLTVLLVLPVIVGIPKGARRSQFKTGKAPGSETDRLARHGGKRRWGAQPPRIRFINNRQF